MRGKQGNTNIWSVAIIGLGNIGMMYDLDLKDVYLTHAKGFFNHKRFDIIGLIDPDEKKRALANEKYPSVPTYQSIDDLTETPDLFIFSASPEVNRALYDKHVSNNGVKHFLIEKPFWSENSTIDEMNSKASINYVRKYLPLMQKLKEEIEQNKWGNLLTVNVIYSKGLSNIGSHFIDLLFFLTGFDNFKAVQAFGKSKTFEGYSFSCQLEMNSKEVQVVFTNIDEDINFYEVDLVFENHRVRLEDLDLKRTDFELIRDKIFSQTKTFNKLGTENMEINRYSYFVADYLSKVLDGTVKNISTLPNEKRIFELILEVKESYGAISN